MPGPTLPVDIINRALSECGIDEIGDLQEGSKAAITAERIYWPLVRQMLAAAHWNFARKQETLVLLADVSGQNSTNTNVPTPWSLMYEWPVNCVHARFVPRTYPQTGLTGTPIFPTSPAAQLSTLGWNSPAPFVVSSADLPNDSGGGTATWYLTEGHDPEQTKVILTNELNAQLIYTGLMAYPDAWDPLFEQAIVAAAAARLAMPLILDKAQARVIRSDNIAIAKAALDMARVRDGDEGWTVVDHTPDWIRARTSGGGWGGAGVLGYGWCRIPWMEDAGGAY